MRKRVLVAIWMILSLLVLPFARVGAQEPFAFRAFLQVVPTQQGAVPIQEGSVIDRAPDQLHVFFTKEVDPKTLAANIAVVDRDGRPLPVERAVPMSHGYDLRPTPLLPAGEELRLTIKGGPNGVRSRLGEALPHDVQIKFRTDDTPKLRHFEMNGLGATAYPDVLALRARVKQGPLKLLLYGMKPGASLRVVLSNAVNGMDVFDGEVAAPADAAQLPTLTMEIPHDGEYDISFAPRYGTDPYGTPNDAVALRMAWEGMDFELRDLKVPNIKLRSFQEWETVHAPFSIAPHLEPSIVHAPAQKVSVFLNEEEVRSNILREDGTLEDIAFDPAGLPDGLYSLQAVAESKLSPNAGIAVRHFMVDRVDKFADVPRAHWAHKSIEALNHKGIVSGRTASQFVPDAAVTREEFAHMMAKTLGVSGSGQRRVAFEDVSPGLWADPSIQAMAERGWISGETVGGRTYFRPSRTITRAEAAAIIGRSQRVANLDITGIAPPFTDWKAVPNWARPSVVALAGAGWVSGYGNGDFRPSGTLTRAEAARILSRFIGL